MTTKKTDNNQQPDETPKDQSPSAQPQDELNNFPWLKSLVPQQGGSESPDEKTVRNQDEAQAGAAPSNDRPAVQPFPKHSREIARTLMETDISQFSDSLSSSRVEPQPAPAQPIEEPVVSHSSSDRPVARTLLETDISQFVERLQPEPGDPAASQPPAQVEGSTTGTPPGGPVVSRTLLETDITMFSDEARLSEASPPEPARGKTQERAVSRTLLEHELPQFSDALTTPSQAQEPQPEPSRPAMTEERAVSRTLLEHELPQFSDGLTTPTEPQDAHTEPSRSSMTQDRNVSRTLLETDISGFADALQPAPQSGQHQATLFQPQPEQPKVMLNFDDSQSFSDLQSTRPQMPFPDQSIPPEAGLSFPDASQHLLYGEDPNQGANMTGRNPLPERTAPKTLLDKEMLLSHLAGPIERLEAAEKHRIETQPMKAFQPIENYKMTAPGCPWSWEDPRSKDKVAFCSKCNAQAYNFEGMQLPEALKLVFQRENIEKPRLYKREDGKFMTRDCPIAAKRRALPLMIIGGAFLIIALIAFVFLVMPGSIPSVSLPSFQQEEAATPSSDSSSSSSSSDRSRSSSSGSADSSSSSSSSSDSSTSSSSSDSSSDSSSSSRSPRASSDSSSSSKGEVSVTSKRPAGGWRTIQRDASGSQSNSGEKSHGDGFGSSSQ